MSWTLSGLALAYRDVQNLTGTLGQNLDTLGLTFNKIIGLGLTAFFTRALLLVSLDLEDNAIKFNPTSQGVDPLRGRGELPLTPECVVQQLHHSEFCQFLAEGR